MLGASTLKGPGRVGGDGEAQFQSPLDSEAGGGPRATQACRLRLAREAWLQARPGGQEVCVLSNRDRASRWPSRPCCPQVSNYAASAPVPKPNPQRQGFGIKMRLVSSADLLLPASPADGSGKISAATWRGGWGQGSGGCKDGAPLPRSQSLLALPPLLGGKQPRLNQ